jgi:protein NrfD
VNFFVADPEWGWWIILYFFLGGLSAGSYFLATLIEWMGQEEDRPLARLGYRLAFPLIAICGIFLIVDLERPERFWHMMLQSEVVDEALEAGWPMGGWGLMLHAPMVKWWSPMSIGAAALGFFGLWSFLSFVASFWQRGILARILGQRFFGHLFRLLGSGIGFFVASYTGVLLTATNQPLWSLSEWIAPLFLTSASSTAIAAMLLLGGGASEAARRRLEKADLWALGLELFLFLIFLASLGGLLPIVLATWDGRVLVAGTLIGGLLIPLGLHLTRGWKRLAAAFALAGGFLLRFGIVRMAPALLAELPRHREQMDTLDAPLWPSPVGIALVGLTAVLAVAIPLMLRKQWRLSWSRTALAGVASLLACGGVLFYAMQPTGAALVLPAVADIKLSPELDRERGGGVGASVYNRPKTVPLRVKFTEDAP